MAKAGARIFPVRNAGLVLTVLLLALFIYKPAFVQVLHQYGYDTLIRRQHLAAQADAIVIIDIDERSLASRGQWPWPRYLVADMVENLREAGAKVIALDMTFPEPDRTSPDYIEKDLTGRSEKSVTISGVPKGQRNHDLLLARQLAKSKTVIGCYMDKISAKGPQLPENVDPNFRSRFYAQGKGNIQTSIHQAQDIKMALPVIRDAASNSAFFNSQPDKDNVIRRSPLLWGFGKRLYPSLGLETLRLYLDADVIGVSYDEQGIESLRIKQYSMPTDRHGQILVNYRKLHRTRDGSPTAFPVVAATDVLDKDFGDTSIQNKIVFIGTSAVGLRDLRSTPLLQDYSGVQVHANIVDNILSGDVLRATYWMDAVDLASILLGGLFITFVVYRFRSWAAFLFVSLIVAMSVGFSLVMFKKQIVFVPSYLAMLAVIMYPLLTMLKFWRQEKKERWIRGTFGAMVSKEVLSQLESDPEKVMEARLKTNATMMFCDVANFTPISEKLTPDEVANFLNHFLSPMTEIVMRHNGFIDKYIGDMIMAVWGAPIPDTNHAAQACKCALEMQKELKELQPYFQEHFDIEFNIRIGLNSGPVTAGNMGSEQRFEYTVIGEAVNVAARLEPMNKQFGTFCIIGEDTFVEIQDEIEVKYLDAVALKGVSDKVKIYELLALKKEIKIHKPEAAPAAV